MQRATALRVLAVVLGLALLVWAITRTGLSLEQVLGAIESLRSMGIRGFITFMVIYAVLTWTMAPASWHQGAAGFLYGPLWGFLLAWVASTTFGWISFVMARGRLRSLFARRMGGRMTRLDKALTRSGWKLVAMMRLPPVSPYNVLNYAFGLTGVSHRDYLLGSALGALLPVVVYTQIGASISELAALVNGEAEGPAGLQFAVLGATLLAAISITRAVRKELAEATDDDAT